MFMNSGFRIEISPRSKLGKKFKAVSKYLRTNSSSTGALKKTISIDNALLNSAVLGKLKGTWTVRPSDTISFKGVGCGDVEFEYVYGKLTIGLNIQENIRTCLLKDYSIKLMVKVIDTMFPELPNGRRKTL